MENAITIDSQNAMDIALFGEDVRRLAERASTLHGNPDEISRCVQYDLACSQPEPVTIGLPEEELREKAVITYTSVVRSINLSRQLMRIIRKLMF